MTHLTGIDSRLTDVTIFILDHEGYVNTIIPVKSVAAVSDIFLRMRHTHEFEPYDAWFVVYVGDAEWGRLMINKEPAF